MSDIDKALNRFKSLEKQRQQIKEELFSLGEELCSKKPGLNEWSLNDVVSHLLITEQLGVKYINNKKKTLETLSKTSFVSAIRRRLLAMVLALPFKYKAPQNAFPENQSTGLSELFIEWDEQRKKLKELLLEMQEHLDKELWRHPLAGRMNLIQMMEFYNNHISHHTHQIKRIKNSLGH